MSLADLVPVTPLNQPYWDGLRERRLTFQRCRSCQNSWLPPREQCPKCLREDWTWETASGHGRLISWVVYHSAPNPEFTSRVPYNVAIVELEEGPRLITNLVGIDDGPPPRIEAPVELVVQDEGEYALARFRIM